MRKITAVRIEPNGHGEYALFVTYFETVISGREIDHPGGRTRYPVSQSAKRESLVMVGDYKIVKAAYDNYARDI